MAIVILRIDPPIGCGSEPGDPGVVILPRGDRRCCAERLTGV
jgi:hypothetical protein